MGNGQSVDYSDSQIWLRHSGEEDISEIPDYIEYDKHLDIHTYNTITQDLAANHLHITHLHLYLGKTMLPLHTHCPLVTHLQLCGIRQSHSLECLKSLHQLHTLNLKRNGFKQGLPSVITKLKTLTKLNLSGNNLTDLPRSMMSLRRLVLLDLSENDFSKGLPQVVTKMTSLTKLILADCKLTQLPLNMKSLHRLETLMVGKNEFSEDVFDVITEMSLTTLSLSSICFTNFPESMILLRGLQSLDISGCFNNGLPNVITELKSLKELDISYCVLRDLPQSMKNLEQLQTLHLWTNVFDGKLPDVVAELRSLTKLNLARSGLTELPASLSSLQQLEILDLSANSFSDGLPEVVTELTSLKELMLCACRLTSLPERFHQLINLSDLNLSNGDWYDDEIHNMFTELPPVIYRLSNLRKLDLTENTQLRTIHSDLLKLTKLESLDCALCESMDFPPKVVCDQGLPAIKAFFEDLLAQSTASVTAATVAVVGKLRAGKTSLVRSLKNGKRHLTYRNDSSLLDDTTCVFNTENLQMADLNLRLIDFGGHQVYHITYQLTIKDHGIPIVVVNLEEFVDLSNSRGPKEATRRLSFDWLSHLYLACPRLGQPILALSHRDKVSSQQFERSLQSICTFSEDIRTELLKEEAELKGANEGISRVTHLSDTSKPVFHPDDVFVFDNDEENTESIEKLKKCIQLRSVQFQIVLPQNWKSVGEFLEKETCKPYVLVPDLEEEFSNVGHMKIILQYLHDSGQVLLFKNKPALADYVFHQIPTITDMIAILFHHCAAVKWKERVATVTAFTHKGRVIEKQLFTKLVRNFQMNGILDEAVLSHILKTESKFPEDVAVELLQSFHIIHGPVKQPQGCGYIIPYFSTKYMDRAWLSDGYLQLRLDILFNGLAIPQYVYQLMTVVALNFLSDEANTVKVAANGATILHGSTSTYLIHDYSNSKVTLQVSTSVELLDESWRRLLELTQHIVTSTMSVWKAARPVFSFYCSHCLFLNLDHPDTTINPSWFRCSHQHLSKDNSSPITTFSGVNPVACDNDESEERRQLTVPKPLRYPCYELTDEEKLKLEKYLYELEQHRQTTCQDTTSSNTLEGAAVGDVGTNPDGSDPGGGSDVDEDHDKDSVCSDISDTGYADFTNHRLPLYLTDMVEELKPTSRKNVLDLYNNTSEVYRMSEPVRGRVVIINNEYFYRDGEQVDRRKGSDVDQDNLYTLFSRMSFQVDYRNDLTRKETLDVIKKETKLPVHHQLGMFTLVILSHGTTGGIFLDIDCVPISLTEVKDLLSASQFPAMKGKPKIIIFHACSGGQMDFGDAVDPQGIRLTVEELTLAPTTEAATGASALSVEVTPPIDFSKLTHLDVDDFFVVKPSTEGYIAMRSKSHGTWFIRILVATFYKHSCHRDIEQLFKIIQDRVRTASIDYCKKTGEANVTPNVPASVDCTFTHFRKLYLFPKKSEK